MRSVRSRLAVVLVPVLLLPLVVSVLAIGVLGPRQQRAAALRVSQQAATAVVADLAQQCVSLGESGRYLALQTRPGTPLEDIAGPALSRQETAFAAARRGSQRVGGYRCPGEVPATSRARASCPARGGS